MSLDYIKCPRCRNLRLELHEQVCVTCWATDAKQWESRTRELELGLTAQTDRADQLAEVIGTLKQVHVEYCADSGCDICAVLVCPHHEPLHYHHDGCPACDAPQVVRNQAELNHALGLCAECGEKPIDPKLLCASGKAIYCEQCYRKAGYLVVRTSHGVPRDQLLLVTDKKTYVVRHKL